MTDTHDNSALILVDIQYDHFPGGRNPVVRAEAAVHIPEASGRGFRFNVGAHSGVTWAHIPDTWAARTRPILTRSKRRGDRGRQRAVPAGTVAEWNVTPCAESKKFSGCISTAT
jgi:nicotinamidase-related amidase